MFDHLAGLNPEQREAVMRTRGSLLVLAGAGTGKTRVITARIAQLIAEGQPARSILAVTFTNKAAREMRERLAALVGKQRAREPFVGTFHRFCLELLRAHHAAVDLPARFSICDASDQVAAVRRALAELDVGGLAIEPRAAHARISLFKNRMLGAAEALESASDDREELVGRAYRRYEETLRSTASVDFDDILLLAERLLRTDDAVRAAVRERYRFVLVDEYQDTNGPQYEVIRQVAGGHRNLCVVGDDDQSIYGWRGADVARILRFEQDFKGAHVVRLETNYRSTSDILDAANRVIANNPKRHAKTLRSALGPGDPVRLRTCEDDAAEALATAREIQELVRRREARCADVAILFRTGTQPRVFETHLRLCAIPYVLVGGPSFFDRREVRDVLAYLRLLANEKDEQSFLRVVNCPPRGIGKTTLERAIGHASRAGVPVAEVFASGVEIEGLTPQAAQAVVDFGRLLATLRGRQASLPLAGLVREVLAATGYRGEVERRYPDPAGFRERWAGVEEIEQAAVEHERRHHGKGGKGGKGGASLERFLQELALSADDDPTSEDTSGRNAVTLMTLHAAKGLEFPRVYLVGLEEGLLPHARAVAEDGIEEERRLAYVGITRAQRHLTLSYCTARSRGAQRAPSHPSRFLFELQKKSPPAGWAAVGGEPRAPARRAGRSRGSASRVTRRRRP